LPKPPGRNGSGAAIGWDKKWEPSQRGFSLAVKKKEFLFQQQIMPIREQLLLLPIDRPRLRFGLGGGEISTP
jgi:hypothetical protein